jgi:hypothetical protein
MFKFGAARARRLASGLVAVSIAHAHCNLTSLHSQPAPLPDALKEHRTHLQFVLQRRLADDVEAHLMGCNVRCMLGWCKLAIARAYAFGLYVDDDALKATHKLIVSEVDDNPKSSSSRPHAVPLLLDLKLAEPSACTLSIVLVMARDIAGEHLAHGFRNSVINRLKGSRQTPSPAALASGQAAAAAAAAAAASATTLPTLGRAGHESPTMAISDLMDAAASEPGALPLSAATPSAPPPSPASSSVPALAEVAALADAFNKLSFSVGDEVVFSWGRSGTLDVSVIIRSEAAAAAETAAGPELLVGTLGGTSEAAMAATGLLIGSDRAAALPVVAARRIATVTRPDVVRALFDVYCGDTNPVSARARDTFNANLRRAAVSGIVTGGGGTTTTLPKHKSPLQPVPPPLAVDASVVRSVVLEEHASRTK